MKNFIEVAVGNSKCLININTISLVNVLSKGNVEMILTSPSANGSHSIRSKETYEEIKALIQAALLYETYINS